MDALENKGGMTLDAIAVAVSASHLVHPNRLMIGMIANANVLNRNHAQKLKDGIQIHANANALMQCQVVRLKINFDFE